MASDGPEWFVPKRYGWGATPVSWQGWVLTIAFVAASIVLANRFGTHPLSLLAMLVPLTILFLVVVAKTTRGGWRWRWGGDD